MRYGFGIDVGGTTIKLAFLDENGTMIDKWEIPTRTQEGGKNVLPDIAASVKEYMEKENLTNDQIIGIGIGVPGPVSDADGLIVGEIFLLHVLLDGRKISPTIRSSASASAFPVPCPTQASSTSASTWAGASPTCTATCPC